MSGANVHDSQALLPLVLGIPAIRSRRGPRRRRPGKLGADKAYHSAEHLRWLRSRGIVPRIARPGIESSERLGRHRWKIERSISWLFGYRCLTLRYERKGTHFLGFLGLAAAYLLQKAGQPHHMRQALSSDGSRVSGTPYAIVKPRTRLVVRLRAFFRGTI